MTAARTAAPVRVVCVGGGYGAIYLARALRGAVRRGDVDLTVIDQRNFHTFHGLVPELLVGKIQAGQVISPARRLFAPGRFMNAIVEAIDVKARRVRLSRPSDGHTAEIAYDHLVVNLGSVDDLKRYRGLGEHTMRLKSYTDCLHVRNHILAMLELADLETDPDERQRLLTFVVAGGNYAGIETAGELSEMIEALDDPIGVGSEVYEDGQVIVREGDVGSAMYIVRSGEVEVVRRHDGGEEVLARFGAGEYFGEVAVLQNVRRTATVRAVGPVELLRISRDDTKRLTESFGAFGRAVTPRVSAPPDETARAAPSA